MKKIKITGLGYYLPDLIETSEEFAPKINKSADWIISRTGVKEKRISTVDVDIMGAIAAKEALKNNGIPDLILNASGVGKQIIPDTSVFFQKELGLNGIPAFSIHATCLSFLVALNVAANFISNDPKKYGFLPENTITSTREITKMKNFYNQNSYIRGNMVIKAISNNISCFLAFIEASGIYLLKSSTFLSLNALCNFPPFSDL